MSTSPHPRSFVRQLAGTLLLGSVALIASPAASAFDAFTDIGGQLAGVAGNPQLQGVGTLQASTSAFLGLSHAAPNRPAALFVSFTSVPVPFKGGTLKAFPQAFVLTAGTDAFGLIGLSFLTPPNLPTGLEFFTQWAIQDPAAINGVSLSNALRALVPEPGPTVNNFLPVAGPAGSPLTLNGLGFSANPAEVLVLVGGLMPTPVSGSATDWTGILPVIPPQDISAEPIQVVVGTGQKVGPAPGDFVFPPTPGILSTGPGQLWSGNASKQSFTTSSLFNKTASPPDLNLAINAYAPNVTDHDPQGHVIKVKLPLGNVVWGPNAHVAYNLFFENLDFSSYAISNSEVKVQVGGGGIAACAGAVATHLTVALNAPGVNSGGAFALANNLGGGQWEICIFPTNPLKQVCGSFAVFIN